MSNKETKTLNLALQGGGAHGAFTWGVLDRLLCDGRINIESISGSSAGAMNALVLASGYLKNKNDGARSALKAFWENVASVMPSALTPMPTASGADSLPSYSLTMQMSHFFSPAQINPFNINPLRNLVKKHIDFELLQKYSPIKLHIAATHANSGRLRVFSGAEINCESLLASACIPMISPTIIIDDEPYWDGGFSANPAIFPIFHEAKTRDILIVMLHPLEYNRQPVSAIDIRNRLNELSMNSTFLREMQLFARLQEFSKNSQNHGEFELKVLDTRFHLIPAHARLQELLFATKMSASIKLILELFAKGEESAQDWLENNFAKVGKCSSINLAKTFQLDN